ncbi:transcriptional repressor [Thalassoglobus sp. JC818]|uniref:Fur family transcriptional regulator n=1 Tax=Thalassoglobus sp. JC818 TaxID=3232136 RepID=UPI0034599012
MADRTLNVNPNEVEEIRQLLRERKIRATPARISVMQQLRAATSPLTHADLAETLVPLGFDKATVFRNLADLTEADLISRTELGDHVWRFEIRDPDNPESSNHPHFVCVDCGDVRCLDDMTFTAGSRRKAKDIGSITEILIKGHCRECDTSPA